MFETVSPEQVNGGLPVGLVHLATSLMPSRVLEDTGTASLLWDLAQVLQVLRNLVGPPPEARSQDSGSPGHLGAESPPKLSI